MSDPTRDQLAFFIRAITCCHGRVQHTHVEDPELEQELADALMPMFASLQRDLAEARATVERYKAALDHIASWSEGPRVTGRFDEPNSAVIAREALGASGGGAPTPP